MDRPRILAEAARSKAWAAEQRQRIEQLEAAVVADGDNSDAYAYGYGALVTLLPLALSRIEELAERLAEQPF